MLAGQALKAI